MTGTNTVNMKKASWMLFAFALFAGTMAFPVVSPGFQQLRNVRVAPWMEDKWSLYGKSRRGRDSDDRRGDVYALNKARTDIRNFLTQRSLQSFLFLLSTCRDSATVRWIEVSNFCVRLP
jgi:hypothetical protein